MLQFRETHFLLILLLISNIQFSTTCQVAVDSSNQLFHRCLSILALIPFAKLCDGVTMQRRPKAVMVA